MPPSQTNYVLNLPTNRVGRDFVVGDLCGEYELILGELKALKFDSAKDRLFHIGHLVDAGGSMTQCIRFIRTPGVFALRSNAEQQLVDLFEEGEPEEATWASMAQALGEAGAWLVDAGRAQRQQVVDAIRLLPLAIAIGGRSTEIGLVHGAVPINMSWREFASGLSRRDPECVSVALWGSQELARSPVPEVNSVVVCYRPDWNVDYAGVNINQIMPGIVPQLLAAAPPVKVPENKTGVMKW